MPGDLPEFCRLQRGSLLERLHEISGVQFLSGSSKHGISPIVAGSLTEDRFLQVAPGQLAREERTTYDVLLEVVPELGGDEVAEDVVVVVDRCEGDVQLSGPVGLLFAAGRPPDELNLLDEIPPQGVEVVAGGGLRREPSRSDT
jgi:hypothetical protein